MITSSTSEWSTCGVLRSASLMQCASWSSGRVMLSEPRNDFANGVRELATTTASLIFNASYIKMLFRRPGPNQTKQYGIGVPILYGSIQSGSSNTTRLSTGVKPSLAASLIEGTFDSNAPQTGARSRRRKYSIKKATHSAA